MAANDRTDRRWMVLFLAAALALGFSHRHFPSQSAGLKPLAQRKAMADVTLLQLGGGEWKLSGHRGQVVLLNYWATWCEPCLDELQDLLQVTASAGPSGLSVVGISMDTASTAQARAQEVQQYVTLYRVPYPIAFPDAAPDAEWRDITLPTTVLLDKQGRVAKTYVGVVERAVLAKDVAALLAET